MRLLDWYIVKQFLMNYLLALLVLIGMYVLFDLVVNFEKFAKGATPTPPTATAPAVPGTAGTRLAAAAAAQDLPPPPPAAQKSPSASSSAWSILALMLDYYAFQVLVIFQHVAGVIPLLAAGFTMVRMTRHHELTAMLASGVSLYRVAAPIVVVAGVMALLTVINQEFVISRPDVVEKLLRRQDELSQNQVRTDTINFVPDLDNSLLSAREYNPHGPHPTMTDVMIVKRVSRDQPGAGMPIGHTYAESAEWMVPPGELTEAWVLKGAFDADDRPSIAPTQRLNQDMRRLPLYIYHTSLTPEQLSLIASRKAVEYLSSADVYRLISSSPEVNKPPLYKIMHLRFTQPLMNIIMLLMGIPFLLTREPARLIMNMLYCVVVAGVVFATTFVIFEMSGSQLPPLWAAWLPVLIFGPLSLVMMDFIHT